MNLASNDRRIKIVNNGRNHGLLYSRAMGILNSSGKYLMNLDPDDELTSKESLEYLYNQTLKYNVDIVTFDIYNSIKKKNVKCNNKNQILKQPLLFKSIFTKDNIIRDFFVWNKLVKKEIFLKAYEEFRNEIYSEKWNYFEDDIWSILINKYAKSKICLNKLIYIYNYNKDSLMNKRFEQIEFKNLIYRHEKYKKLFSSKEFKKYLIAENYYFINRIKSQIKYVLLIKDKNIKEKIINIFKYFLNNYKVSNIYRKTIHYLLNIIK